MRARALVVAGLLVAQTAHADAPRATAAELFAHGRALALEGRCEEAIPFFVDTLKIEASIGALLNLADCREKLGRIEEAYRTFRQAEALARLRGDDRETLARGRGEGLATRLPKIEITAPRGASVTIDGLDAAGTVVVGPGDHVVRANAPNKEPWEKRVHAEGTSVTSVVVPELTPLPAPIAPLPKRRDGRAQRTAGVTLVVLGGAALSTSFVLGGLALAKKNDAAALASGPSEAAFDEARGAAKTFADASTAVLVAGVVLAVAGVTLFLTAPRVEVAVAPSRASLFATLRVRF